MKQINFKIEKTAAEVKTYIEFNSLIEYLKERSKMYKDASNFWLDLVTEKCSEEEKEECFKNSDLEYERSSEIKQIEYNINKLFIEFTKEIYENGFD